MDSFHPTVILLYAAVAGLIPAIIWLGLILFEDREHPEPRKRLVFSFGAGMLGVILVLPYQLIAKEFIEPFFLGGSLIVLIAFQYGVFAFLEEIMKFALTYVFALRTRDIDEPLDEIVYLAAVALGFAAFENSLFLLSPLLDGEIGTAFLITNVRFVGATLVHLVSAIIIGVFMANAFYKPKRTRIMMALCGVVIASIFHMMYNIFLKTSSAGGLIPVFLSLWLVAGYVLLWMHFSRKRYIISQ